LKNPISFKSLLLGTLLVTLLILLVGLFWLGYDQKRTFLEENLAQLSQDAATSLALSISSSAGAGDWVVASTMVDVIFDSGAYARVELRDTGGKTVFNRTAAEQFEGVPAWLVRGVALETPVGEADVVSGWKKLGHLQVQSSPAAAYRELWRSLKSQLVWFALVAVGSSLVLRLFLHQILAPLTRLVEVAGRIQQKDFGIRLAVPKVRELAEVTVAVNQMAEHLNRVFQQQHETIERLRTQTLVDPVTGLDNRDSFDRRLGALLNADEGEAAGYLVLLQIKGFAAVNQALGRKRADVLLATVGELLRDEVSVVRGHNLMGRREGAQFVAYFASSDERVAREFAERLLPRLRSLPELRQEDHDGVGALHFGIVRSRSGLALSDLLSRADFALRKAQSDLPYGIMALLDEPVENDSPVMPASDWQGYLRDALSDNRFELHFQPMLKADRSRVLFHQVLLRLRLEGRLLPAGEFLPMAERFGLMHDIDHQVLRKVLQRLSDRPEDGALCVTLSSASLHRDALGLELRQLFERFPMAINRLLLEVPEYALRQAWAGIDQLLMLRTQFGFRIVVSRFGMSGIPFGYLDSWPVNMIKLDPGLVGYVDENPQHQFYLRNIVQIAHSKDVDVIVVGVERKEEVDVLEALKVDGLMGYFICRPQSEPVHIS
jgi:diguanylate cyclase (GGDEF)-like protein